MADEVNLPEGWRMIDGAAFGECSACKAKDQRIAELRNGYHKMSAEIDQTLGRALGYPRYCDDQRNFPGSTDVNGVCTGDHVPETLATEAAKRIAELERELAESRYVENKSLEYAALWEERLESANQRIAELENQSTHAEVCKAASEEYLVAEMLENSELERQLEASQERERKLRDDAARYRFIKAFEHHDEENQDDVLSGELVVR